MTGTISGGASAEHPETVWLVAAGAAILGLGCLLVAAGAISSTIFGGGRGRVLPHSAQFGTIIRGTLSDPSRPAAAWPAPLSSRLPGPVPYWGTFAILAGLAGVTTAKCWTRFGGHGAGAGGPASPVPASCVAPRRLPRPAGAEPRPAPR